MINFLLLLLVGWPAIAITFVLGVIGLLRTDYRLLVAGAVLAFPFSWYISGFPLIRTPAFLLPLLLFGAGYAMYRGREMFAWILAVPYFLTVILLLFAALASGG